MQDVRRHVKFISGIITYRQHRNTFWKYEYVYNNFPTDNFYIRLLVLLKIFSSHSRVRYT